MGDLIPVSVYVITQNEEKNIKHFLDQLTDFQEVILVDSGSTDHTVDIANSYDNVKSSFRAWTGFSDQKAHALSLCSCEWVLNLDADEELSEEYLAELKSIIHSDEYDALESKRILLRWGRPPKSFIKDDILIRLFRKSVGHYESARVHERISVKGRIKKTDFIILHHENLTFSQRMDKSNKYSQLKAEDKFEKGHKANLLVLILIFPVSFIQCYLGKGCFLDGRDGLLTSMNFAYYNFMKYAKLWELHQGRKP